PRRAARSHGARDRRHRGDPARHRQDPHPHRAPAGARRPRRCGAEAMTTCEEARSVAAEVALGLVTGAERGAVHAHLETCPSCRRDVDALAAASDRILQLAPPAEPPPGFETRVLWRIGSVEPALAAPVRHRGTRWAV